MNRARALALGVALAFGWHLALRAHGLRLPLMCDEGEYAYVARVWSQGGLPYRDAFSQKPPMIHAIYRLAATPSDPPAGPRAAAILAALLTAVALLRLTPRAWGTAARLAAPASYLVLCTLPVGDFGFPANTEVFAAAFAAWAFALAATPLAAGLLAGAALMTKQTALWPVLAAGAYSIWLARKRVPAGALFAAGAAAVPLAWCAYYLSRGAFGEFWDCAYSGNMRYASVAGWSAAAEQGRFFAAELVPSFLRGTWPAWALAAWGLRGAKPARGQETETAATAWLAGGLLAAATGLLLFPHYFLQAAPALCLAAACGVARLGRRGAWAALAALALWPAAAHARLYFASDRASASKDLLYPSPMIEVEWLGDRLRGLIPPGETLYVYGSEQQLYVYAGRNATTKHDCVYPLTMFPKDAGLMTAEMAALRAAPPRYVVYVNQPISTLIGSPLGLAFREAVRAWLAADYRLEGYVPVPREPAAPSLVPSAKPDWTVPDRLYVFARKR